MWIFLILVLLAAIGGLLWVHYQKDQQWQREVKRMENGEYHELTELSQFAESEEEQEAVQAEIQGKTTQSKAMARLRLLAAQYCGSKQPEAEVKNYIDDSAVFSQDSIDEELETIRSREQAHSIYDLKSAAETVEPVADKTPKRAKTARPPRIPEITPFWQEEPTEYISERLGNHANLDVITLEDATRSLQEAMMQEMAEQRVSHKRPAFVEPAEEAPKAPQPAKNLETIDLNDPSVRRTRERVMASVQEITQNMPSAPVKEPKAEPEVILVRQEIGVDDIQENLVRTRAARRKIAAVEAPQQGFQPQVIPDEEVYANLLQTTVPAARRPIRRIDTSTRESVIPETARVEQSAARVQAVQPRKPLFPPKTTPTTRESVYISKPAAPTATVVEPPPVPEVPMQKISIAEPPVFSTPPEIVPREPAGVSVSNRPSGKIADLLISEAAKVVVAESLRQPALERARQIIQTASRTEAEKDAATEAIFERPQRAAFEPKTEAVVAEHIAEAAVIPAAAPAVVHTPVIQTVMPSEDEKHLPGVDLLLPPSFDSSATPTEEELLENSITIEEKLAEFKVKVKVVDSYAGPVITRYEIEPDVGVRGNAVLNLEKDLARSLGVASIRVVETIPGKTCMGLELPNKKRQTIRLSEIFNSPEFQHSKSKLTLALGQDITGKPVVTDLAKAPHMLVAGTTGSGKSVGVNAMILSMLFKATPEEVRMIMIDPKMLELSIYEGIPHLLAPVVTDMKLAANALNWCVNEMEKRYRLMSHAGVRNLEGFNEKVAQAAARGERMVNPFSLTPDHPEYLEKLPFIVVVVDEFADLMMTAGKQIEQLIARLAQKARAAGIHLILATQRPSVDVITGLIKANIPTRIAFQVSSKIDSRTIIDQMGAENLLGQGDMLFVPPGTQYPQRVHGAFASDDEVHGVVEYLKQFGEPDYVDAILNNSFGDEGGSIGRNNESDADPMYDEAVALVVKTRKASISGVQRQLRIGYNRAARMIEQMESDGIVSAAESNGNRTVLAPSSSHLD